MRGRTTLEKKINNMIKAEVTQDKIVRERIEALTQFGFSKKVAGSYIMLNENIVSADDYTLYCLAMVYLPKEITTYFLDAEIKRYSTLKLPTTTINNTITLNAVQISDNQWIGRISAKELMKWRDAQIINYNENAQRTLRHITTRGRDFYQIYLNQEAVNTMVNLFEENKFIPNTLTFNLPESIVVNYDEMSFSLQFNLNGEMLDILDGYHRYIALSRLYSTNRDFDDFNMEIRIVQFDSTLSQQFIWQEDQKTQMRKIQSESMNQYKLSNQITQRVNNNPNCEFYLHITPNGIINKGYFSAMVEQVYCKRVAKNKELTVQKEVANRLCEYLNKIAEAQPWLLNEKWPERLIYAVVYASSKENATWADADYLDQELNTEINKKYMFNNGKIAKKDLVEMSRLLENRR